MTDHVIVILLGWRYSDIETFPNILLELSDIDSLGPLAEPHSFGFNPPRLTLSSGKKILFSWINRNPSISTITIIIIEPRSIIIIVVEELCGERNCIAIGSY